MSLSIRLLLHFFGIVIIYINYWKLVPGLAPVQMMACFPETKECNWSLPGLITSLKQGWNANYWKVMLLLLPKPSEVSKLYIHHARVATKSTDFSWTLLSSEWIRNLLSCVSLCTAQIEKSYFRVNKHLSCFVLPNSQYHSLLCSVSCTCLRIFISFFLCLLKRNSSWLLRGIQKSRFRRKPNCTPGDPTV